MAARGQSQTGTDSHPSHRHDINYRTDPELFSNRIIVNTGLFDVVADLIEGHVAVSASAIVATATLAEAVVLNEEIIVTNEHWTEDYEHADHLETGTQNLLWALGSGGAIGVQACDSAANALRHELSALTMPGDGVRVHMPHGSHLVYEWDDSEGSLLDIETYFSTSWRRRAEQSFDERYRAALQEQGCYSRDASPWNVIAGCHGIPYCSDILYSVRDVSTDVPTNIGIDLYRKLEEIHEGFFRAIKRYLGPTYVPMPAILGIVLSKCRSREDIPEAMIRTRDQFSLFRARCTQLEHELRCADTLGDQVAIVSEVRNAYRGLARKADGVKRRLLYQVFDVIKQIDPVKMATSVVEKAIAYDLEREALVKLPGYYDLYKASLEAEQGLPLLQRLFGDEVDYCLLSDIQLVARART